MKFTIDRKELIRMLDEMRTKLPRRKRGNSLVTLSACAARVFVAADEWSVVKSETLVLEDGECVVPSKLFTRILESFDRQKLLTVEADAAGLRIGKFSVSVLSYSPTATPPGDFQVFPVTDLGVAGTQSNTSAQATQRGRRPESREAC